MMIFWRKWIPGLWLVCLAMGAQAQVGEAELKASFILSFAKFVTWPAEALNANPGELVFCLLGNRDTLYDALSEKQGKQAQQLTVRVRHVARGDNLKACQILVFADSEAEHFEPVLRRLAGQPVLTINGSGRFLEVGGNVGLFTENDKLRFDINLAAARQNGLAMSSNLLRLARTVKQ
jgi:hypothetical protein